MYDLKTDSRSSLQPAHALMYRCATTMGQNALMSIAQLARQG